jgi:hypothetical protein
MASMSERPPDGRPDETLWVVDVTAPLPPGRVRLVAAEAAARLHLPAEKLVALLENRIGPVTKPLPKASADRVAEVLDLAGADVAIRSAAAPEAGETPSSRAPSGASADDPRGRAQTPSDAPAPSERPEDASRPTTVGAETHEADAGAVDAPGSEPAGGVAPAAADGAPRDGSEVAVGRSGRGSGTAWSERDEGDAGRAWPDDLSERDEDDAMLGAWRRRTPAEPLPVEPEREPADGSPSQRTVPASPGAAPGGPAATASREGLGTAQAPGALDVDDEEEAERRDRALRRWTLGVALLVAVAVFLALQWAYSVPGPQDSAPPAYEAGLRHYRDGAFVSAARAWTPRAEAGDAQAMFMLGWMAEFGQGRPWSNREAAGWYRQAAERGHGAAAARLAGLYDRGLGVARSDAEALRWYLQAATDGRPEAQREAAHRLAAAGRMGEARAWLRRAAAEDPRAAAWRALLDATD